MAGGGFGVLHSLRVCVERENACTLPGVPIVYEKFIPVMWKAVAKGFVKHEHAVFVQDGLRNGFKAGVDVAKLKHPLVARAHAATCTTLGLASCHTSEPDPAF